MKCITEHNKNIELFECPSRLQELMPYVNIIFIHAIISLKKVVVYIITFILSHNVHYRYQLAKFNPNII